MKRDNINYFAVGLFVLLMLGLLLYGLLRISGENQKSDVYYSDFRSIAGIKPGAPVTYQGFELGHVDTIEPRRKDGKTYYRLALKLRRGWQMPSDSVATISASGLLSGMLVEIREGSSRQLIAPGGVIGAVESSNLFESMSSLTEQLSRLAKYDAEPLLENLNRRVDRIGGSLEQGVPESMSQLQALLKRLNSTAALLEATVGGENRGHVTAMLKNADLTTANILRLSADFERTSRQLDQLLSEAHGLVKHSRPDVEASVAELRDSLQRVNAVLQHLESASLNTNELARELRQNPSLIIQSRPLVERNEDKP